MEDKRNEMRQRRAESALDILHMFTLRYCTEKEVRAERWQFSPRMHNK